MFTCKVDVCCGFRLFLFQNISYSLILERRGKEKKEEREKSAVPVTDPFIGRFLYVS